MDYLLQDNDVKNNIMPLGLCTCMGDCKGECKGCKDVCSGCKETCKGGQK